MQDKGTESIQAEGHEACGFYSRVYYILVTLQRFRPAFCGVHTDVVVKTCLKQEFAPIATSNATMDLQVYNICGTASNK